MRLASVPARSGIRDSCQRPRIPDSFRTDRVLSVPIYLQYYFWLVAVSLTVFTLERIFQRKPPQEIVRAEFVQDLFWLVFNAQYVSWGIAIGMVHVGAWLDLSFFHLGLPKPESIGLLSRWPIWGQFLAFYVLRDFLEWNIHRMLHRVPWLWRFHKLHHSIEQLDWLSTFRAHWSEAIIYKVITYLPLVILGVDSRVIFAILVTSLFIQELIHANLPWSFGPFRFLITSPRFHAWHHDMQMHGKGGQNFAIDLPIWDWMFGTVYWPKDTLAPARLGFLGMTHYPRSIWGRLWDPFFPEKKMPAADGAEPADPKNG